MSGNASGGAGRTASGLAMLMGNASKILQTVAANIDRDVVAAPLEPLRHDHADGHLGHAHRQESIQVMGVNVAIQRETERSRQMEFLQATATRSTRQIMGPQGRAKVLRAVSKGIGLDGEDLVPTDDDVKANAQQQAAQTLEQQGAEAQGNQQKSTVTGDMGPRTAIAGGAG
jgi:hypothetical protein